MSFPSWPLIPALVVLIAFFLVPLLIMTGISFVSRGPYGGIEWILTWENYVRLADPLYWHIFIRSVGLAVATTLICVVLGFPLAYLMARSSPRVQYLLICLVLIPFWTNFLVRTYAWMFLLRADGLVNTTLRTLGLSDHPVELLYTPWAVLIGLVYGYLPFMVLPLYAAIERIAPSLEEAARDLYATGWAVFTQVVLPLAKPGLVAGCVLVFVPSLGAFITPHLLGGGQTMMIGTLIQHEFLVVRDWPFGAALSLVFMATVLLILLLWLKRQEAMWRTL